MSPSYRNEDKAKDLKTAILLRMKRRAALIGQNSRTSSAALPSHTIQFRRSVGRLGPSASRPVIPKRGEKEYEPASESSLQKHNLESSRAAMFSALAAERTISKYESFHRVGIVPPDHVSVVKQ